MALDRVVEQPVAVAALGRQIAELAASWTRIVA